MGQRSREIEAVYASRAARFPAQETVQSPVHAAVVSANAQLHDEPQGEQWPSRAFVENHSASAQATLATANSEIALFREICLCADGSPETTELIMVMRERLQRSQADLQSMIAVAEAESALMELLAANEAVHALLAAPAPAAVETSAEERSVVSPAEAGVPQRSSETDELSSLLGLMTTAEGGETPAMAAAVSESNPLATPPTQLVKSRSEREFEDFFGHSSSGFGDTTPVTTPVGIRA